jgi:hypothetical protein
MSFEAKLGYVLGVEDGTFAALRPEIAETLPSCVGQDALKWTPKTQGDLVREMDAFYSSSATHLPLATYVALVYSTMKENGASPKVLEDYVARKLSILANRKE